MSSKKYDIVVIGAGPGGFTAAVRAAQFGAKVVVIEKSLVGGTCLNCGCIPTKFLWQSLKIKREIQKSYEYGLEADLKPVVFADIMAKKDRNTAAIRKGMEAVLASYDIETVKGNASFSGRDTVKVLNGEKDEVRKIFADKFIIASGTDSSALKEFAFDGDRIISSTNALDLKEMPESMLIIGGGAIGIEMATVFSGFGCRVTLAEYESYLLPNEDREISEEIRKNLAKQSVEVWVACSDALNSADNYEKVLIVTGRTPNSVLGLEEIGVRKTEKGFIETDEFCRTSVDNIYAVGDITGKNLLAYAAQNEGAVAAENAAGLNSVKVTDFAVPQVVFSMPPSSSIKVKDFSKYKDVIFGKFPFAACGRAFIEKERTGFVKCAVDKKTRKLLAFWIVGAHSDELINTASQIIVNGMGCLSRESIFHPSLSESLLNAYEDAFGRCVELVKNKLKL